MRKLLMGVGVITLVFVLAAAGILVMGRSYLTHARQMTQPAAIEVKRGARLRFVLDELARKDVLTHPAWLYAYARLNGETQVRTGAYQFSGALSPQDVLTILREGRVTLESFTVAEGLNRWQIRDLLKQHQWLTPEQFDALCDNTKFLEQNHVPGPTCEGYLYPETYKFARGVTPEAIFETMFLAYRHQLAALTAAHCGKLTLPMPLTERQMVTLASIVEKETGAPSERPHIACIFYNRLQAKPPWRMETDPTVIYAATLADPNFNGNLTRRHLHELDNPYNTYRVYGLPPGPIANPGAQALEAVISPIACPDFFFVSSNNGQHIFCPTLGCHEAAVKKWQVEYFRKPKVPKSVATPLSPKQPPTQTPVVRGAGKRGKHRSHRASQNE